MLVNDFARTFTVGRRYRVTLIVRPLMGCVLYLWQPKLPRRIGKRLMAEYEMKRNAVLCSLAERLNGKPAKVRDAIFHKQPQFITAYADGRVDVRTAPESSA